MNRPQARTRTNLPNPTVSRRHGKTVPSIIWSKVFKFGVFLLFFSLRMVLVKNQYVILRSAACVYKLQFLNNKIHIDTHKMYSWKHRIYFFRNNSLSMITYFHRERIIYNKSKSEQLYRGVRTLFQYGNNMNVKICYFVKSFFFFYSHLTFQHFFLRTK